MLIPCSYTINTAQFLLYLGISSLLLVHMQIVANLSELNWGNIYLLTEVVILHIFCCSKVVPKNYICCLKTVKSKYIPVFDGIKILDIEHVTGILLKYALHPGHCCQNL